MNWLARFLIAALAAQLLPLTSYAGDFAKDVERFGGEFALPKDYIDVTPQKNRDMRYDFAIRHPSQKFEVRYALLPTPKQLLKEDRESAATRDKSGKLPIDLDKLFLAEFHAILFNITQQSGTATPIRPFPAQAVHDEFAADSGAVAVSKMKSQFGTGYKECMIVGLHKNGVGDLYIFYLYDNASDAMPLEKGIFHALKFRSETN